MRQILDNPEPTVDLAFQYVKTVTAGPIYALLNERQAEALDELLYTVHSCGELHCASLVKQVYDRPDERRTCPQILLDIKVRNESIIAQVVPTRSPAGASN